MRVLRPGLRWAKRQPVKLFLNNIFEEDDAIHTSYIYKVVMAGVCVWVPCGPHCGCRAHAVKRRHRGTETKDCPKHQDS